MVKGVHFESLRDAGDPVEQAARYDAEGADELVFLDISASNESRATTLDMVARVAERLLIPFTVGAESGRWKTPDAVLRAGADKIAVNTAAVRDPELVRRLSDSFGAQCIVAAVDVKRAPPAAGANSSSWTVYVERRTRADCTRRPRVDDQARAVRGGRDSSDLDGPGRHPDRL